MWIPLFKNLFNSKMSNFSKNPLFYRVFVIYYYYEIRIF